VSSSRTEPALKNPSDAAPIRPLLGIALVSFSSLLLELALTRLFSVVLFYHFAFLAISVARLGLGAGGVYALAVPLAGGLQPGSEAVSG